ncbi:type 2 isopentenyl-diphosphate Delta-isomerase [Pueribacillus theae]|uniref:Isopentenyl-diphosphate delta-isomerase n=1 Tax=Pueribacillus theae TaxID=2171751 RepID=A0A2U1K5E4_9BACI|nr:type 2 isopentenyl-diphosphate Delta-isomerase [Pueribacillus theae]PWA12389.1 type 2 isopentenyl-diphosphate Delta-isomerase [Pueribacillus theae]
MREKRKKEHIEYALSTGQSREHGFHDVTFVHQSLPGTSLYTIDLTTKIGELDLSLPIFINAMTGGGGRRTEKINSQLAEAARECNLAIGVGSQMAAIKDPFQERTYKVMRDKNPNGVIFANLGSEATVEEAKKAIEMIEANALQIHVNAVQELVMPEGDRDFCDALLNIEKIAKHIEIPLIVKEVGYGMSKETAKKLLDAGVNIVDIGGFGGTNFSLIENKRRDRMLTFMNEWGIQTASSIAEVTQTSPFIDVIASGGIQTGLEVAKSIALGASACGMAGFFLNILLNEGLESLIKEIEYILNELKMIMTALGRKDIQSLQKAPIVISGNTHHWLTERGIKPSKFSNR